MICSVCGNEMGGAAVCPFCGAGATETKPKKGVTKNILSLLGFILSLAGVSTPSLVLGILGLVLADSHYDGQGKKLGIWAIVLSVVMPTVYVIVVYALIAVFYWLLLLFGIIADPIFV